jgi:hypothetical protein
MARIAGISSLSVVSISRLVRRHRRAVEDKHVLCESANDEVDVHLRQLFRRDTGARLRQNFEPDSETIGVELLV